MSDLPPPPPYPDGPEPDPAHRPADADRPVPPPPPPPPPSGAVPPPPPPPPSGGEYQAAGGSLRSFSATEAIGYGWKGFTNNLGAVLLIAVVVVGINILVNMLASAFDNAVLQFIVAVIVLLVSLIVSIGLVRAALAILDGHKPELSDLLSTKDLVPYAVAWLLASLIIGVGTLLCIIPGVIAAFLLQLFTYAIVDQRTDSPVEALKISFNVVSKNVGQLLVLAILSFLLNLAGTLLCGIGLIVTIPVTAIALAYAWRFFSQGRIAPQP